MRSAPASGAPRQAPTRPAQRPTPAAYPKRKKPRLSSRGPACAAKRRFLFYTPVLGFCLRPASPAGAGAVPSPGCAALLPFGVLCQTKNAPFPLAGPARPYCPHPAFRPAPFCAPNPHCVRKLLSVLCAPHRLPVRRRRHRPALRKGPRPPHSPNAKSPGFPAGALPARQSAAFCFIRPFWGFACGLHRLRARAPCLRPAVPHCCLSECSAKQKMHHSHLLALPVHTARTPPSRASGPHNGKPRTRRLYACTAPKMMVRAASPLYLLFPVPSVFLTSALFFVCCAAL